MRMSRGKTGGGVTKRAGGEGDKLVLASTTRGRKTGKIRLKR